MRAGSLARMIGVPAAALLLALVCSQTTLYSRVASWLEDSQQRLVGRTLPLDHVVVFDVDEESMQRLAPRLGAWPYPRTVYAQAMRYLSEHGARAVAFDILFSEARPGDDTFAATLDRRSVVSATALPFPLERPPEYLAQLRNAALFPTATSPVASALARVWPDLTLPLPEFTREGRAHIGVMSAVADADGVVRRLSPLHQAYGEVLPSLPLAALLAGEPDARVTVETGGQHGSALSYRVGARAWPAAKDGSLLLRFPANIGDLAVVPFYELMLAAAGAGGEAHLADLVRGRIVFVGSSSAVLGDFAFTPAGRLPGLRVNALMTEMLIENQVRRPPAAWIDTLLALLALALPLFMVWRGIAARPREFLFGLPLIAGAVAGAGLGLFALGQQTQWLFALICGVSAQAVALVVWLFAIQRERQRLYYEAKAARDASRMKSEFLTHMTHELRTPITAIMGFNKVNQLTDDLGRDQRVRNSAIIGRNCEHLLGLVNNNLDLARIEAGQLSIERRPEDVAALLEEVASTVRLMAAQKGLSLQLLADAPLPRALSVDAFRLRQVLINLLGNAVKFTEQGTVVLEAQWNAGELVLCVRDTGPGIPAGSLARIFEPFERAAGARIVGSGLGLAITRKLVVLMDGSIVARSAAQSGTTFEVRIPAAEVFAPEPEPAPQAAAAASPARLSGRVLVAEDNESLRELIELQLRELGIACRLVANGFEAVEAASNETFDAVLMDMDMPLMDGFEAVNVLKERGYARPVVAFTAYAEGSEVERARAAGCDAVLSKPVSIERLRATLKPLLGEMPPSEGTITVKIDSRIAELLPRFLENCRRQCDALRRAAAGGVWAEAGSIGHSLRGAGGGYGFDEVTRLGVEIEIAARENDAGGLRELASRLEDYLSRVDPVFE